MTDDHPEASASPSAADETARGAAREACAERPAESPAVHAAAEAVRAAEAELKKARALYENIRHQAVEQLAAVRRTSFGDVVDGTLQGVRRHPGLGVLAAALVGFFLGRLFRR